MVDKSSSKDSGVTSVALRPTDGRCVVTGSLDEVIRIWDIRTGQLLERFEGHEKSVYSVSFSTDGLSIVSGSLDQTLRIWDLSHQTNQILSSPPTGAKIEVVRSKNCRRSFVGHQDYVLTVGYPGLSSSIGRVDPHGRPINDPSFDLDWVVSGGKDRHVIFWDAKSNEEIPMVSMSGHKNSGISD
jgi:general transcriptional corepressor TUP1